MSTRGSELADSCRAVWKLVGTKINRFFFLPDVSVFFLINSFAGHCGYSMRPRYKG